MADEVERRIVQVETGPSWTPAQILALVLGVVFVVLGGVALLRTGIGTNVFEPTATVAGLAYTPLLGMIEVVFGLILLAAGAFPGASDAVVFLGVLALAFGLLLVIEPGAFQESLAAGEAHGWFYVVCGGLAAATGLLTPTIMRRWAAASGPGTRVADRRTEERVPREAGRGATADERAEERRPPSDTETRRIEE